ncbi:hypothetical protein JAAARDRAFT_122534 [Jaapia argillacea MUCL 33604]|uniref:Zn(2)-C6 fungal-type domain-containing protein n=1 Tax=Jaapia argillacea MUCL 33604 TaxID=933084 RepID=A0A067Q5K6_9AGAM|nr:hypothetical protein JAAARDRAFT_122534 [Jaapia argillacea MUCL 33604]
MVAGRRTGKTSFLRLLLDTSFIAPTATQEQLASLARFVQGCGGHTGHIRSVSIDVTLESGDGGARPPVTLTLIDTPSLEFEDDGLADRLTSDIQRHVESRLADSMEDEVKAISGDHHVHLCVYFLDPDTVLPPSSPTPPVPVIPRARTNSLSHSEPEPVILEPPVTTNPLLCRPVLPLADINTIRRLSARVNVLPVVARADTLTNDRLAAVKMAIRRDLAEAGIGFGIFDVGAHDSHPQYSQHKDNLGSVANGVMSSMFGPRSSRASSSATSSPPASPISPTTLRLPYALISPDIYSHTDGVSRPLPSRHELVQQYIPSSTRSVINGHAPYCKIEMGRFTRTYRWGALDILDPSHCDFLHLRTAIFHHMQTLHKYTKEYLLGKFMEQHQQQHPAPIRPPHHGTLSQPPRALPPPLSHASRPILAIETIPQHQHPAVSRHPSLAMPVMGNDPRNAMIGVDGLISNPPPKAPSSTGTRSSQKQRPKKITVACNFCRSRKLKCDGGRPACSQCLKRSNPCDYMPNLRRGGARKQRKQDENSDSDQGSDEDQSGDHEEPSLSPDIPSRPLSRRGSNVNMFVAEQQMITPVTSSVDRHENMPRLPSLVLPKPNLLVPTSSFRNDDAPHIATLPTPVTGLPTPNPEFTLPPIRSEPELSTASKRRGSTSSRKGQRSLKYGPKVVACNFCRARKTKCDGAHPSCSSCARRSLQCSYVNDPSAPNAPVRKKKGNTSPSDASQSSPPSSHFQPSAPSMGGNHSHIAPPNLLGESDGELKRNLIDSHPPHPPKKMRLESSSGPSSIPVAGVM